MLYYTGSLARFKKVHPASGKRASDEEFGRLALPTFVVAAVAIVAGQRVVVERGPGAAGAARVAALATRMVRPVVGVVAATRAVPVGRHLLGQRGFVRRQLQERLLLVAVGQLALAALRPAAGARRRIRLAGQRRLQHALLPLQEALH